MLIGLKVLLISLCAFTINAELLNYLLPVDEKFIQFIINTWDNPTKTVATDITNPVEVLETGFNRSKETYFCVHAFIESATLPLNTCNMFKDEFFNRYDVNFIRINWGFYTSTPFFSYVRDHIDGIANIIAGKIKKMVETSGLDLNTSQMVGTSLGGDLVGAIGAALDGKLYQVIGIEPGAPDLFKFRPSRMTKNSGQFVQVIHSCFQSMLKGGPTGHADYYANGGERQPWCFYFEPLCSHASGQIFYINSLKNGIRINATKCDSYENYTNGLCASNDESLVGGFHVDRNASGKYFFTSDLGMKIL